MFPRSNERIRSEAFKSIEVHTYNIQHSFTTRRSTGVVAVMERVVDVNLCGCALSYDRRNKI
jgi:hypothetical protein